MKPPDFKKMGYGFFRSNVARRIFFLFILCALLPMSLLAYFTYNHSTKHLYQQAYERLTHDTKSIGMAIIERLLFLETDIKLVFDNHHELYKSSLEQINSQSNGRLKARFKSIAIVDRHNKIIDTLGNAKRIPLLNALQEKHIKAGKTIVTQVYQKDRPPGIYIIRASNIRPKDEIRIVGEIDSRYLWGVRDFISFLTDFIVIDAADNLLVASIENTDALGKVKTAIKKSHTYRQFNWQYDGESYLSSHWDLFMYPQFLTNWKIILSQSKTDILAPLNSFKRTFQFLFALSILVVLLLSIRQIRSSLVPLDLLQEATQRVARKDFTQPVKIETDDEFNELGESFNQMANKLKNHFIIMSQINRIGIALSMEKDNQRLMEIIIEGAKEITHADAGCVYLMAVGQQLKPSIANFNSIKIPQGKYEDLTIPLFNAKGRPNTSMVAACSVNNDSIVNISDIYAEKNLDFTGNHDFDKKVGYRSQSILSIPMKNHDDETLGVLQLINAKDMQNQKIIPFSEEDQKIVDSIASQAAVALNKNHLIHDFKKLFDSLVELIATAIDEKSHHTGEHCRRVPELAMRLATTVNKTHRGPYKDTMFSDDEMYELKTAALLHDCGKVTTPAHIMDKASKLETIFDRIHLIETRFEILKRDFQLGKLKETLNCANNVELVDYKKQKIEIDDFNKIIDDDLIFIKACNTGETFMTKAFMDRVDHIADKYSWLNVKGEMESVISSDERYNLHTLNGTITEAERHILNQHVVATSKMLESLSYPKPLKNVPKFASRHHERMDGNGYPKGLREDQIPLQARIITIADIFESLTATNRPYKKGKTFNEALQIMSAMKEDGQIDPVLFDVFVSEKVYLYYTDLI